MYNKELKKIISDRLEMNVTLHMDNKLFKEAIVSFCEAIINEGFETVTNGIIDTDIQVAFNEYLYEVMRDILRDYIIQKDVLDIDTISIDID